MALTAKQTSVAAVGATRLSVRWPTLGLNHSTTGEPRPRKSSKIKSGKNWIITE